MIVERGRVVRFHYTLCDEGGTPIDSSRDREPVAVLHGHGNVLAGIDEALAGRSAGERFRVTVTPDEGYGPRREGLTDRVPRSRLRDARRLEPGDPVVIRTARGPREASVIAVGRNSVEVDLNHPLAGRTLVFEIEVLEVRAASPRERADGHVNGIAARRS